MGIGNIWFMSNPEHSTNEASMPFSKQSQILMNLKKNDIENATGKEDNTGWQVVSE